MGMLRGSWLWYVSNRSFSSSPRDSAMGSALWVVLNEAKGLGLRFPHDESPGRSVAWCPGVPSTWWGSSRNSLGGALSSLGPGPGTWRGGEGFITGLIPLSMNGPGGTVGHYLTPWPPAGFLFRAEFRRQLWQEASKQEANSQSFTEVRDEGPALSSPAKQDSDTNGLCILWNA